MAEALILQSAVTFSLSASLAVYVALQRQRTLLHSCVLALLGAFMAWTGGAMLIFGSGFDPLLSRIGAIVTFAGVIWAPPIWLFLCARIAHGRVVNEQPLTALAALSVPTALNLAAFVSDPLHGLFAHGMTAEIFTEPVSVWAGPLFWVHAIWSYLCVMGGIVLCCRAARRRVAPLERRRFTVVALAAAVPLASALVTMSGILPASVRLTPADLGLSGVLIAMAVVRYRFLDTNLLPASEVISHLNEALVLADSNGTVVHTNPAAQRLFEKDLDAMRGQPLEAVVAELAPGTNLVPEPEPDTGEHRSVQTVTTEDGRVLDFSYARVFDRDDVVGSFLVARDRTEQHRAERALHHSQRLASLGVLVAGIAHEINNPLAFVRTNLAHLGGLAGLVDKRLDAYEPQDADALREMSEVILETQGGIDRISRIVDATRKLSRQPQTARDSVDLNDVVEGAIQIAALHSNRNVVVTTDFDAARPHTYGSAEQLGQVLLNLLINGKQATELQPEGRIHVETRAREGTVEVRVHDNGPGVDAADLENIFAPFFTTKDPDAGTGLGLAIAFDIAEEHDGNLEVCASDLGGACFVLALRAASS